MNSLLSSDMEEMTRMTTIDYEHTPAAYAMLSHLVLLSSCFRQYRAKAILRNSSDLSQHILVARLRKRRIVKHANTLLHFNTHCYYAHEQLVA